MSPTSYQTAPPRDTPAGLRRGQQLFIHGGVIHEELAASPERTLPELERERFGWDHAEVGEIMCEVWGLPPGLGEAVGAHHLPVDEVDVELAPLSLSALLGDDEEGLASMLEAAAGHGALEVEKIEALALEGLRDAEDVTRLLG